MKLTVNEYNILKNRVLDLSETKKQENECLEYCENLTIPYGGTKTSWDIGFEYTFDLNVLHYVLG